MPSISCGYSTEDSKSAKGPYCRPVQIVLLSASFFPDATICPMKMCLVVPTHVLCPCSACFWPSVHFKPKTCITTGGPKVYLGSMHLSLLGPRADRKKEEQAVQ